RKTLEAARRDAFERARVFACCVGLQHFNDGIVHGLAAAVVDAAFYRDGLARRVAFGQYRREQALEVEVVLLGTQPVREERAYGLGRRLLQDGHGLLRGGLARTAQHDVEFVAQGKAFLGGVERKPRYQAFARVRGRALENRIELQQRIAGEVHLGDQA